MHDLRAHPSAATGFPRDPRSLTLPERAAWRQRLHDAQSAWQERLPQLVEPPAPGPDFPAFLLETPPFQELNRRIGEASRRAQLPVAVADELQHFVDVYRSYLHTRNGEEVFPAPAPARG